MSCTSATTFFRACRARPARAAHNLKGSTTTSVLVLQRSKSTVTTPSPFVSSSHNLRSNKPSRNQQQQQQQRQQCIAPFSTRRSLRQASAVNDIPSSSSAAAAAESADVIGRAKKISTTTTHPSSPGTTPSPSSSTSTTSSSLSPAEEEAEALFLATSPRFTGHVTRVGTMQRTVRVTRTEQVWHAHFQKHYKRPFHELVHDPLNILLEGDVVTYGAFPPSVAAKRAAAAAAAAARRTTRPGGHAKDGKKKQDGVKFVLREVITPFGVPVEMRTPRVVGSPEGRWKGTPGEVKKIVRQTRGPRRIKGASSSSHASSAAAPGRA